MKEPVLTSAPATLLFSMHVSPADVEAAGTEMRALNEVMRLHPGFRHLDVLRHNCDTGVEFCLLVHFVDETALQIWKDAPARREAITKAQLALIMRAVRSVGFLRRRRVSRGEFGVLE
jgi:antibiotic biosynthesis monooxygenase (ABM) superfamily enzyme